jgi:hypothetical protein
MIILLRVATTQQCLLSIGKTGHAPSLHRDAPNFLNLTLILFIIFPLYL